MKMVMKGEKMKKVKNKEVKHDKKNRSRKYFRMNIILAFIPQTDVGLAEFGADTLSA